jgi:hypothetical protein
MGGISRLGVNEEGIYVSSMGGISRLGVNEESIYVSSMGGISRLVVNEESIYWRWSTLTNFWLTKYVFSITILLHSWTLSVLWYFEKKTLRKLDVPRP